MMNIIYNIIIINLVLSLSVKADSNFMNQPVIDGGGTTEQLFRMRDGSIRIGFMRPKNGVLKIMSMSFSGRSEKNDEYPDTYDMYVLADGVALVFYKTIKEENRLEPVAVFSPNEECNGLIENKDLLKALHEKRLGFSTGFPAKPGEPYSIELTEKRVSDEQE